MKTKNTKLVKQFQAREVNVQTIVLHSNVDRINSVKLNADNGDEVLLNENESFTLEPQYHFLKINLQQPLAEGQNYTLFINYTNTMNDGPMKRGVWKGWYIDDDGVER